MNLLGKVSRLDLYYSAALLRRGLLWPPEEVEELVLLGGEDRPVFFGPVYYSLVDFAELRTVL